MFIFCIFLINCSSQNNDSQVFIPKDYNGPSDFQYVLEKNSEVDCEISYNCPDDIALVVSKIKDNSNEPRFGLCSGTIISNNLVLTNSHCIPESVKTGQVKCSEVLGIRTAKQLTANCDQVLTYSTIPNKENIALTELEPDYALFRINKNLNIPGPSVSKSGISDYEKLQIYAVDPVSQSQIKGKIILKAFEYIQRSVFSPLKLTTLSPTLTIGSLSDKIIKGNSGSGIRNLSNQIVGIVSHSFEGPKNNDIQANIGFGANFTCLLINEKGVVPNSENDCTSAKQLESVKSLEGEVNSSILNSINDGIIPLSSQFPYIQTEKQISRDGDDKISQVFHKIKCINPLKFNKQTEKIILPVYNMKLKIDVDTFSRIKRIYAVEQSRSNLDYTISVSQDNKNSFFIVTNRYLSASHSFDQYTVNACQN